jgi:hypothetical protein
MAEKIRRAGGDGAPQGDANFKRSAPLPLESTDPQAAPRLWRDVLPIHPASAAGLVVTGRADFQPLLKRQTVRLIFYKLWQNPMRSIGRNARKSSNRS